jgi:hypothetical protein
MEDEGEDYLLFYLKETPKIRGPDAEFYNW